METFVASLCFHGLTQEEKAVDKKVLQSSSNRASLRKRLRQMEFLKSQLMSC